MKVSIIVPVYNEERTIIAILKKVSKAKLPNSFVKEILVVNDASSDKTLQKLQNSKTPKLKILNHVENRGKGAAILTGVGNSTGDLVLIQDADLEYDPSDYQKLLQPFVDPKVVAVYGSRLINYPLRLFGKNKTPLPFHWIANKFLTLLTNVLYQDGITDMETCYKVVRIQLFKSLNIKSQRFDFEPEITAKILKRGINILEVPITVQPRSYLEGKKIGWRDGLMAVWTLIKFRFVN